MAARIQPAHDMSPAEIDAVEERLNNDNRRITGRNDDRGLTFVIRDEAGRTVGVAAGYSWAGTSELELMWIDQAYRGRGYRPAIAERFRGRGRLPRCSAHLGVEP